MVDEDFLEGKNDFDRYSWVVTELGRRTKLVEPLNLNCKIGLGLFF